MAFAAGLAAKLKGPAVPGAVQGGPQPLQLSASFYLLNPDGDLPDTQQTFEAQLQQLCREVRFTGCEGWWPALEYDQYRWHWKGRRWPPSYAVTSTHLSPIPSIVLTNDCRGGAVHIGHSDRIGA